MSSIRNVQYIVVLCFGIFVMFHSCETEMDLDFPESEQQIVVDGWIEANRPAKVFLTYTTSPTVELDSNNYFDVAATHAKVTISVDNRSEVMILKRDKSYFPEHLYQSIQIKGEVGKTYFLEVILDGDTITSSTTIPPIIEFDSLWFEPDEDSLLFLWSSFTDIADEKNYYRTFTQVLNKEQRMYPTYFSAFDDKYFSGQSIEFQLSKGATSFLDKTPEQRFRLGDSVVVKISSVDQDGFLFWEGYERELFNSGNPFSSSGSNLKSNIEGGLGVWCGYGSSYYVIEVK